MSTPEPHDMDELPRPGALTKVRIVAQMVLVLAISCTLVLGCFWTIGSLYWWADGSRQYGETFGTPPTPEEVRQTIIERFGKHPDVLAITDVSEHNAERNERQNSPYGTSSLFVRYLFVLEPGISK